MYIGLRIVQTLYDTAQDAMNIFIIKDEFRASPILRNTLREIIDFSVPVPPGKHPFLLLVTRITITMISTALVIILAHVALTNHSTDAFYLPGVNPQSFAEGNK